MYEHYAIIRQRMYLDLIVMVSCGVIMFDTSLKKLEGSLVSGCPITDKIRIP